MSRARTASLLLLTPLLLAWSAGGSGVGVWQGHTRTPRTVALSGLVESGADVRFVINGSVDGGEALIFVTVPAIRTGARIPVLDRSIQVGYQEYGPDGSLRFHADRADSGWIETSTGRGRATLRLDVAWVDPGASDRRRRWSDVHIVLGTDASPSPSSSAGGHASVSTGCDGTVAPDPEPGYDDGTGCEGDDWESDTDDDWGDDTGGGCEGDDLDSGDSYDSGGGCEGDDLSDGSSDDTGASCEGDAIASVGHRRRSPTVVRIINQLPWLLIVVGLGLRRRRRSRGASHPPGRR